jgi:hypothetical protein
MSFYANLIEIFCRNYFKIEDDKRKFPEKMSDYGSNLNIQNNYQYNSSNNYTNNFISQITSETYQRNRIEEDLINISGKFKDHDLTKISDNEAHIIDYFICKLRKLRYQSFSKRKDDFIRLYGIDYDKFRRNHAKSFQTVKGDPNIKIDPIEKALFYINIQIKEKKIKIILTSSF